MIKNILIIITIISSLVVSCTSSSIDNIPSIGLTGSVVYWNSSVVCNQGCNVGEDSYWIGGVAPVFNQTAIIDYSNSTTRQSVYLSNSDVSLVGLQIKGDLVVTLNNSATLTIKNDISITGATFTILGGSELATQGEIIIEDAGTLGVTGNGSNVQAAGINGSVDNTFSSLLIDGNCVVQITTSIGVAVNNLITAQGGVLKLADGGIATFALAQSQGLISVLGPVSLEIGAASTVAQISIALTNNGSISVDLNDRSTIGSISIVGEPTSSFINITGTVTLTQPISINNTVININQESTLVLQKPLLVGGINLYGDLNLTTPLTLGSTGFNLYDDAHLALTYTHVIGDVYLFNGTITVQGSFISHCLYHYTGLIYMEAPDNSLQLYCYIQKSESAQLWINDVEPNSGNQAYIITEATQLMGELLFSVDGDDITPEFSANIVSATNTFQSTFSHVNVLNGGLSNRDYNVDYIRSQDDTTFLVNINFNRQDSKPKLALWKILLIIFGSVATLFIIALIAIKISKYIKNRNSYRQIN